MKRILIALLIFPSLALAGESLVYTVRTDGTGAPKQRTVALTPGTILRVAPGGLLEVASNSTLVSSLGLGSAAFVDIGTAPSQIPTNALVGLYPVFDIELGGNFTDFELKASTNNWAGEGMIYFYHSPDPAKSVVTSQIWTTQPNVFFTDSQYVNPSDSSQNQRTWRKQSPSQSIAAMRANGSSVIAGATVVVRDLGTINRFNSSLVWSYCRLTPTGYEVDTAGRSIWRTITPKWVSQPINP